MNLKGSLGGIDSVLDVLEPKASIEFVTPRAVRFRTLLAILDPG